jgi:hypothetical protein
LALILLALSPVGLYSGFAENGLALIPVALVPLALSPENRLALIPLALSQSPQTMNVIVLLDIWVLTMNYYQICTICVNSN